MSQTIKVIAATERLFIQVCEEPCPKLTCTGFMVLLGSKYRQLVRSIQSHGAASVAEGGGYMRGARVVAPLTQLS